MKKPRKMCFGVFMDEKFYVIGGIGGPDSKVLFEFFVSKAKLGFGFFSFCVFVSNLGLGFFL